MLFISVYLVFCLTLDPHVPIPMNLVKDLWVVKWFLVRENVVTLLRSYILVPVL